ncbi:16473_t:CDS:2 [Funneliformis caledonium]|uniref:16473_t:CDS:1 n=1 Tax=Funneliformis caledonium TaxID=1117310 RepID=A0A9N8VJX9_9GLOM|nr:16473_t:CDS:2 [Funneliformis caledonium]
MFSDCNDIILRAQQSNLFELTSSHFPKHCSHIRQTPFVGQRLRSLSTCLTPLVIPSVNDYLGISSTVCISHHTH